MLEKTQCNICKLDDCEVLVKDGLSNIVRCRNCRLVYRSPRKTKEDYMRLYLHSYYSLLNKETWYKKKIDFFRMALQRIEQIKPGGRLLDLGSGFGHFLDLARKRGWQTQGVEVSDYAIQFATETLKLDVFRGELEQAHFADNYFDVVTMWNFLDHLHDPLSLLLEVKRILKQDGLVVMRMPNVSFQLPGFKLFKKIEKVAGVLGLKNPFVIHNYGFSEQTLKVIFQRAGFNQLRVVNSRLNKRPLDLINHALFALTQLTFYLSRGRLVLGPTLEAYARR